MGKRLIIKGASFALNGIYGGTPVEPEPSLLPDGYTQLSYIEASGGAYINPEYTYPGGDFRLETKFERTGSENGHLCGTHGSSRSMIIGYWGVSAGNRYVYTQGSTGIPDGMVLSNSDNALIDLVIINQSSTVTGTANGEAFPEQGGSRNFGSDGAENLGLMIFAKNKSGSASGHLPAKLYSFKLTVAGVDIMRLIPCMNDNNEYGLYDVVRNRFFGKQGTGTITGR